MSKTFVSTFVTRANYIYARHGLHECMQNAEEKRILADVNHWVQQKLSVFLIPFAVFISWKLLHRAIDFSERISNRKFSDLSEFNVNCNFFGGGVTRIYGIVLVYLTDKWKCFTIKAIPIQYQCKAALFRDLIGFTPLSSRLLIT